MSSTTYYTSIPNRVVPSAQTVVNAQPQTIVTTQPQKVVYAQGPRPQAIHFARPASADHHPLLRTSDMNSLSRRRQDQLAY